MGPIDATSRGVRGDKTEPGFSTTIDF